MTNKSVSAVLVLVLVLFAGPLLAQQRGTARRVPVTIALVENVRGGAPFLIERRPDLTPGDVIVLRADATAEQLSDAVRSLLTIRQVGGDRPTERATMRMRPGTPPRGANAGPATTRRNLPWVPRVLADVRNAGHREIAGVGRVRAVDIWLPAQSRAVGSPSTE